jgi:hypothetical protein
MRNYWFKIVLGAVGVFAVGMLLIVIARHVIAKGKAVAESSDPVTIPLAFVPFRVDGSRLGTFDQAVLVRKSPRQVTALNLGVKLGDSVTAVRFEGCVLLAKFLEQPPPAAKRHAGAELNDVDFTCIRADSATALGATPFGHVTLGPGGQQVPLFVPAEVAERLRHDMLDHDGGDVADSIAEAAGQTAESIGEAASRMADSLSTYHERRADSIREAALRRADSVRNTALRQADSVRRAAEQLRDSVRATRHRR